MKFIPLNGGNHIGASCYFLKTSSANIIFDCGTGFSAKTFYTPDYNYLIKNGIIRSFDEITHIFISHGHLDHIGDLPVLANLCRNAKIFATPVTKILISHQLADSEYVRLREKSLLFWCNMADELIYRICELEYNCTLKDAMYNIEYTFYDAGHIPGAAMVYLKADNRNILYTGDFLYKKSALTSGYCIPSSLHIDTMIVCGTYAYERHSDDDLLTKKLYAVINSVKEGKSVSLSCHQLTKGVELLKMLTTIRSSIKSDFSIKISRSIYKLAESLESMGYSFIEKGVSVMGSETDESDYPAAVFLSTQKTDKSRNFDFSIHAVFREIVDLIAAYEPSDVYVVHTGSKPDNYVHDIGSCLFDENIFTNVNYTRDKQIYIIS
ncbi:MAG: MBL fold metallo-hydrolase [Oscillospiraceae bacterium]